MISDNEKYELVERAINELLKRKKSYLIAPWNPNSFSAVPTEVILNLHEILGTKKNKVI